MLERLVYVSRAAPGLDPAGLAAMVHAARGRNAGCGRSGALVHLDGWFAQVLEGEPRDLRACFERIVRDPRHRDIDLRIRARVHCPGFRGQAMAFVGADDLDAGLLTDFGYRPGFPVEVFPVDVLVEFVHQALRPPSGRPADPRRADA